MILLLLMFGWVAISNYRTCIADVHAHIDKTYHMKLWFVALNFDLGCRQFGLTDRYIFFVCKHCVIWAFFIVYKVNIIFVLYIKSLLFLTLTKYLKCINKELNIVMLCLCSLTFLKVQLSLK